MKLAYQKMLVPRHTTRGPTSAYPSRRSCITHSVPWEDWRFLEQQPSPREENGLNSRLKHPNTLPQLGTCSIFQYYHQEIRVYLSHRLVVFALNSQYQPPIELNQLLLFHRLPRPDLAIYTI